MSDLWKALGVLATVAIACASAGYLVANKLHDNELHSLRQQVEVLQKASGFDLDKFVSAQLELGLSFSEKEEMQEKVVSLEEQIAMNEQTIEAQKESRSRLETNLTTLENEYNNLKALVEKDFDKLDRLFVPVKETRPLIVGEVAVAVSLISGTTVWLTVTDSVSEKAINLGERVRLSAPYDDCSVVPTEIVRDRGVYLQYACKSD